jgi:hypothetical protein
MKKRGLFLTAVLLTLLFVTCDNFFHDLIPPDGDRIEDFYVPGLLSVEIGDDAITAYVSPGTDLKELTPSIRVSAGATLFPVTQEYIAYAFNDDRTFGAVMELYTSGENITGKIIDMIRSNRTFNRPVLDMPINFGYPVDFLVISGIGTIRQYKIRVEIDTGEGKFKSFGFEKFFNPEVVRSAVGVIDTDNRTVTVDVSYPVENIASYQLTPSFETNGARVYLDGTEWRSGETLIGFLKPPDSLDLSNPHYASQTKTLTLKRTGFEDAEWTLIVNFSEDPDTSRAIIDFRFTRSLNPLLNADYMAEEIYHSDNYGFISVTVYYSGAKPEELRASFISPGTVTVNDEIQISGYSTQDFSSSVRYVVTSKIGNNVRTYSVYVRILPISDPLPQITYFSFRTEQNPLLVSNSTALINHDSRLILIEAAYDGDTPPYDLIPEFSTMVRTGSLFSEGTVSVNGITQRSNSSSVNFSSPVGYVVFNPSNPTLKREYRVEVKFVRALSSGAEITTFTFYKADNPDLVADVNAVVTQSTGTIYATLLFQTPGGDRTLVPRWSAQGRIEVGGVTQTSGELERQFYTPQTFRASSADGVFKRDYTVTVKEINSRIYVKHDAMGRNDGTNWENAYQSVSNTENDTERFYFYNNGAYYDYTSIPREVWIAEGTYTSPYYGIGFSYPNVYLIGGFIGNETSKNARVDPANHKPIITGDHGDGELSYHIITFGQSSEQGGVYSIEDMILTDADYPNADGAGIYVYEENGVIIIKGVEFINLTAGRFGGAFASWGGNVTITDCSFTNTRAGGGGAVFFSRNYGASLARIGNITINNCTFTNTYASGFDPGDISGWNRFIGGGALFFVNCTRVTVTNCTFVNTSVGNNRGNAAQIYDCSNVTESGNTFINVSSPEVVIY